MEICCWISCGAAWSVASAVCAAVKADPHAGAGSSPVTRKYRDDRIADILQNVAPARYDARHDQIKEGIQELNDPLLRKLIGESAETAQIGDQHCRLEVADVASLNGARHDPRPRIAPNIGGKKLAVDPPDRHRFENGDECRDEIAKQFDIRFREAAGRVGCPRHCVNDPIREDERRHHIMRNAFRPQRREDREVPVGGFAKDSIKPVSGFDDVLNRAILVIRRKLDTVPCGANLNTLSTPPDACRSTEFWMERANMCGGAGYRNAQRSELLAEHFKKATDIGRESALLG